MKGRGSPPPCPSPVEGEGIIELPVEGEAIIEFSLSDQSYLPNLKSLPMSWDFMMSPSTLSFPEV